MPLRPKMQSTGGDYPRLRLSDRSPPPPEECLATAMKSHEPVKRLI